jgi:bifunctional UDP-N-acetylglucosamine pyrophosphorylase/glucosamine-1-phosphate N-acetyltransferase
MLAYVIDAAQAATGERPLVVYSPATSELRKVFAAEADFALQDEPRGTGDAVRAALPLLPPDAAEVLVVSGDVPRVDAALLADLLEQRRLDHAAFALTAVTAYDPRQLGRVIRSDAGSVERIVEAADATEDELEIGEINAGLYAFDADWLRGAIGRLTPSARTGELYLTELVTIAKADGRLVAALDVEDDGRLLGINDRAELAQAEWDLRTEINAGHMQAGVTMRDPSTVYVDADVTLGKDVVLEPNVRILAGSKIGDWCTIGPNTTIYKSSIGPRSYVADSVVEGSTTDEMVSIGPFSHIRPGSHLGKDVDVGNFAEVKNSRLGPGVRQHHMSYLGDAEVGARTNIGAGTITANFDGTHKHRTTIGEDVFLGVDTMLRAPVTLGDGSKTGAGAVVTRDVPPGKLAVGVPARIREQRPAKVEPGAEPTDKAAGDSTG